MKIKLVAFITLFTLFFASCSNDNDSASLKGTKWTASLFESVLVIEFSSKTNFMDYTTDIQGNVNSLGIDYGTYTFDGSLVTFNCNYELQRLRSATINGNVMTLTYETGFQRTFMKR